MGFNSGQRWTVEEDEMLSSAWPAKQTAEIRNLFPSRTRASLQHRAERLHLVRRAKSIGLKFPNRKCWTLEENAVLEKMWKDSLTTEILTALPGRTLEAIQSHVSHVLKIKRNPALKNHSTRKIQYKIPFALEKLGYFAGLLDGEGYIHLSKRGHGSSISVANTDMVMLNWIVENFGGKIYSSKRARKNEKACYSWMCAQKAAMGDLLRAVLPFLITKREKAIKFLAICGGATL